jgi:hypothetical protein
MDGHRKKLSCQFLPMTAQWKTMSIHFFKLGRHRKKLGSHFLSLDAQCKTMGLQFLKLDGQCKKLSGQRNETGSAGKKSRAHDL